MNDFALESTLDFKFTTRRFTTGVPFALVGGVISAYPDNSSAQITAGITLSSDFDGVTGLNNIRVVGTAANGYASGVSYALVITAGTVDSVSVVGEVVKEFTLGRSAAFGRLGAPAGASVSADVAAIKTVVDLIKTAADAIKVTTDKFVFTITNKVDASIQAAGDFAQAAADKVWASGTRTLTSFGTLVADVATAVWAAAARTLTAFTGFTINTEVAAVKAKTDGLPADPASESNVSAVGTAVLAVPAAVWAVGTRTLTSFGTLVADVATAVWAAGTRELTGFGSLVADVTTAVWSAAIRTVTAFGFTVSADVVQVGGSTATLDRLKRVTDSEILGNVGAASTTTSIVTSSLDPAATVADQFKGRVVLFDRATTTTALRGQGTRITASTSGGVLTIEALTTSPVSGDTFTIV